MEPFACNTLEVEVTGAGVAEITLQRPQVLNAMNAEMIDELTAVLTTLSENEKVRVLCLQGAGKNFCAGADLLWMKESIKYDAKENFNDSAKFSILLHTLDNFPKPTVAVVEGVAYGGGVGLVACCDIAIGTTDTQFCLAEARLGLVPAIISPYIVSAIGVRAFRYLALLATSFSASHAHNIGLLHEIAGNPVQLAVTKKHITQQLLDNGPNALKVIKELSKRLSITMADTALHQELAELIASVRVGEEAQERMTRFLKKSLK